MAARSLMATTARVCSPLGLPYRPSIKSPLRTSRTKPIARPFRRIDLGGRRLPDAPAGDQLAIDDRIDEFFKSRDRRVPRVLHRERNGCVLLRRPRRTAPRGKPPARPGTNGSRRAPREAARAKNCAVFSSVTAARWRCTASILITRARYTAYSGCADLRAAMEFTHAARSPLRPFPVAVAVPGRH